MNSTASILFRHCMIFITTMIFSGGGLAMSTQTLEVKWEWPAGRQIDTKILISINKVSKASKGSFGVKELPSLADALPDATNVSASIISGPANLLGKTFSIKIPGMEAKELKVGKQAAVGLIESNTICICISVAPMEDKHKLANWFDQWQCE